MVQPTESTSAPVYHNAQFPLSHAPPASAGPSNSKPLSFCSSLVFPPFLVHSHLVSLTPLILSILPNHFSSFNHTCLLQDPSLTLSSSFDKVFVLKHFIFNTSNFFILHYFGIMTCTCTNNVDYCTIKRTHLSTLLNAPRTFAPSPTLWFTSASLVPTAAMSVPKYQKHSTSFRFFPLKQTCPFPKIYLTTFLLFTLPLSILHSHTLQFQ